MYIKKNNIYVPAIVLDMTSSINIDLLLNQCENYIHDNDIMNLIKQCLHKLCLHQPDNPIHFLKLYFSGEQYEQVREFCPDFSGHLFN